jgi:hypothetical protein
VKDIIVNGFVAPFFINQKIPIYALRDRLQEFINVTYISIVQQYENQRQKYIAEKLK